MSDENKKKSFSIYWIYALLGVGLIAFQLYYNSSSTVVIKNKQTLYTLLEQKGIDKIDIVNKEKAEFELNASGKKFLKGKDGEFKEMAKSLEKGGSEKEVVFELEDIGSYDNFENELKEKKFTNYENKKETNYLGVILSYLLPFVIIIAIWIFVMRRMSGGSGGGGGSQIFNIGKSRAQVYDKGKSTNITFQDVAGLQEAKVEIEEIVEFLKNSKKYTELGAKIPKGALLVGPPGTGKTLLAKAVAGEAKVPFFSLSGSDFVEMFVGVGAKRVRELFEEARKNKPCIIFIDEIDTLLSKSRRFGSEHSSSRGTINAMLTEMDGFDVND